MAAKTDEAAENAGETMQDEGGDRYNLGSYEAKKNSRIRLIVNIAAACIVVVIAAFAAFSAWDYLRPAQIEAYANETVDLIGIGDSVIEITPEELSQLDCQLVRASNISDRAGQGQSVEKTAFGYGPTLDEVLAQYGYSIEDFRRIVIDCRDGYQTAIIPGDNLDGEVYVSIAQGKDALPESMWPMRLIMPEMPPGQWVYCIDRMTFESKD